MSNTPTINEIVNLGFWTVKPSDSVQEVCKVLKDKKVGCIGVADEQGKLLGVFSERDVVGRVVSQGKDPKTIKVEEVMTANVITITNDKTIQDAYVLMVDNVIRHLPVVDKDGTPVAMLGLRDLTQAMMNQMVESFMNAA